MYDIASLRAVVEDAAIRVLDGCNCGPLLSMSTECNMLKLEVFAPPSRLAHSFPPLFFSPC
jgi:hypothetical protein